MIPYLLHVTFFFFTSFNLFHEKNIKWKSHDWEPPDPWWALLLYLVTLQWRFLRSLVMLMQSKEKKNQSFYPFICNLVNWKVFILVDFKDPPEVLWGVSIIHWFFFSRPPPNIKNCLDYIHLSVTVKVTHEMSLTNFLEWWITNSLLLRFGGCYDFFHLHLQMVVISCL